jgi:hypothetical protein
MYPVGGFARKFAFHRCCCFVDCKYEHTHELPVETPSSHFIGGSIKASVDSDVRTTDDLSSQPVPVGSHQSVPGQVEVDT